MNKRIPIILLYSRPVCIVLIFLSSVFPGIGGTPLVLGLVGFCVVSDILDGILARQFNVSSTRLRVLDTLFDLAFYLVTMGYVWSVNPDSIEENLNLICTIILLEASLYSISLLRFGKTPSPHAFLSKIWGLYLVVEVFLLLLDVQGTHFTAALWFGMVVHSDRLLIYVLIRKWDHDIPSCYHAWLHRSGKPIVRHKLLNG